MAIRLNGAFRIWKMLVRHWRSGYQKALQKHCHMHEEECALCLTLFWHPCDPLWALFTWSIAMFLRAYVKGGVATYAALMDCPHRTLYFGASVNLRLGMIGPSRRIANVLSFGH